MHFWLRMSSIDALIFIVLLFVHFLVKSLLRTMNVFFFMQMYLKNGFVLKADATYSVTPIHLKWYKCEPYHQIIQRNALGLARGSFWLRYLTVNHTPRNCKIIVSQLLVTTNTIANWKLVTKCYPRKISRTQTKSNPNKSNQKVTNSKSYNNIYVVNIESW